MIEITRYRDKVMACWLGKAIGGTLGMPYEGREGPYAIDFYTPVPTEMVPNDDLDLQVLWADTLSKMDTVRVDRQILADAWRDHVQFPWDEYGVALRNIANGLKPPQTGSFDNWFVSGLGAAIRSELWACLAPGDPDLAALYAYEDACVDHAGEGIWVEVFLAALQSAAFSESRTDRLLDTALMQLPITSLVRRAVTDTRLWWAQEHDWRAVRTQILAHYGHENVTDSPMNAAFTVLGWLAGEGDFGRSICTATNCGKDTDSTSATVGSLLGISIPDCISEKWLAPIGRDLVLSPEIVGIIPPRTLDDFTDLVLSLRQRLAGRAPDTATATDQPTERFQIPVEIGFTLWPPNPGEPAPEMPAETRTLLLPGTWAHIPSDIFTDETMVARMTFHLDTAQTVEVMLNSPNWARVWIDGEYAFGRDGGLMAPSLHRNPTNQKKALPLAAGEHELRITVRLPLPGHDVEWVVCVGDAKTHHWLPHAFAPRVR